MKTTINVTLGGQLFVLEEDAYQALKNYLDEVERIVATYPERADIMADIEARLAEELKRSVSGGVVTTGVLSGMLTRLGTPEELRRELGGAERENVAASSSAGSSSHSAAPRKSRRLYRDPDDQIVSGVCSGIAAYIGVDPTWVRIGFAVGTLAWGAGVFVYLLLLIIVPEAKTPEQKAELHGEPLRLADIVTSVRNAFEKKK